MTCRKNTLKLKRKVWLDIVLVVIIIGCLVWGAIKGGIREIFGLVGVILGILGASKFYTFFPISNQGSAKALNFIIIFVVITLAIYLIGFLVYSLIRFLRLGFMDRALGLILGSLKGSLFAAAISLFISLFPYGNNIVCKSKIVPVVFWELRILRNLLPHEIQQKLRWHTPREPIQN